MNIYPTQETFFFEQWPIHDIQKYKKVLEELKTYRLQSRYQDVELSASHFFKKNFSFTWS